MKIDKGVPLPPSNRGRSKSSPWRTFDVGDSTFIVGKRPNTIGGLFTKVQKELDWKFTLRTVTEDGVRGVRVWRIK